MNPFDALIAQKTPEQRREWLGPVKRNGTAHIAAEPRLKRAPRVVAAHCADRREIPLPFAVQRSGLAAAIVASRTGAIQSLEVVLVTDFFGERS